MAITYDEDPKPRYLTASQAAKYLGFASSSLLRRWRQEGVGPAYVQIGRDSRPTYLYHIPDLDEWMNEHKLYPQRPHETHRVPTPKKHEKRPVRAQKKKPVEVIPAYLAFRKTASKPNES